MYKSSCRILEVKNEMVKLDPLEFHYFDDLLTDMKLTPVSWLHMYQSEKCLISSCKVYKCNCMCVVYLDPAGLLTMTQEKQIYILVHVHKYTWGAITLPCHLLFPSCTRLMWNCPFLATFSVRMPRCWRRERSCWAPYWLRWDLRMPLRSVVHDMHIALKLSIGIRPACILNMYYIYMLHAHMHYMSIIMSSGYSCFALNLVFLGVW